MTLNDQIDALVLKNKVIKPVNMTAFKNPFLLLSSTRALNELVSNTAPSDRARQQGIEDDKAYLKTPTGARSDRKAPKKDEQQDTQQTPPKPRRGRKPDAPEKKEAKKATKDIIKEGAKNVVKIAKAAKAKADKAATAKKDAELKATAAAAKAETAKIKREREAAAKEREAAAKKKAQEEALAGRREGDAIPLGNTRVRGGNSSDRRLGTKTQKKKK